MLYKILADAIRPMPIIFVARPSLSYVYDETNLFHIQAIVSVSVTINKVAQLKLIPVHFIVHGRLLSSWSLALLIKNIAFGSCSKLSA